MVYRQSQYDDNNSQRQYNFKRNTKTVQSIINFYFSSNKFMMSDRYAFMTLYATLPQSTQVFSLYSPFFLLNFLLKESRVWFWGIQWRCSVSHSCSLSIQCWVFPFVGNLIMPCFAKLNKQMVVHVEEACWREDHACTFRKHPLMLHQMSHLEGVKIPNLCH